MTARLHASAFALLTLMLEGCSGVGPAALNNGRSAYNAVINETEDEQILSMIVRKRYDETFGMLAVSNVTASLRVGASIGGNIGVGPRSGYEGNLVPLSAGVTYEENPTISYVPMQGEKFVQRMLSPVSAEQALLLSRMSTAEVEVLRFMVRRANGVVNPLFSSRPAEGEGEAFDRFIELYTRLRDRGRLDIVLSADDQYTMLFHDYGEDGAPDVAELLRTLRVQRGPEGGAPITVPLRFFVGALWTDGVDLETPSALEVIEAAAAGVEVPEAHLSEGIAQPSAGTPQRALIKVHASRNHPAPASVAVKHRGWWFFVDGRDTRSKQAFMVLRTLIGLRLDDAASGQRVPVLTIPVAR